jgi:putative peptide zinc metalloprotease protein
LSDDKQYHDPLKAAIADSTRLCFHDISTREDGDEWIVGRVETGQFVSIPPAGRRAIELLSSGCSVGQVRVQLQTEMNAVFNIADFVVSFIDLGFVSTLNGHIVNSDLPPRSTFPWLRPAHVKWTLHPLTGLVITALVLAAILVLYGNTTLVPRYHDLIWDDRGSVVILGNAAIGWTIVLLHELGHLSTSRAAGVPARMSFGTRLQFLVAQTDVSGVWVAPRRIRLTVYLAGMAVNLAIAASGIVFRVLTDEGHQINQIAGAVVLLALLGLPTQLLIFMRTDIYFVLQDLAGTRNLYANATTYLRCRLYRAFRLGGAGHSASIEILSKKERRVVRAYSAVLLIGTTACITVASAVTLPAATFIVARAFNILAMGGNLSQITDAVATLLVGGTFLGLWLRAWWRRHGHHVQHMFRRALRAFAPR